MLGIDYGELDLERFVGFVIDTATASLEVKTIPDRKALQYVVERLGYLHHKLVGISLSHWGLHRVELSPAELFRLAVYAFQIASFTCSDSSEVIAARWRAKKMSAAPGKPGKKRATSAEINRIIDGVIDGHRPDDIEGRGAQKALVSDAQTKLAGFALTEESVRGRVQRRLSKKVRHAL